MFAKFCQLLKKFKLLTIDYFLLFQKIQTNLSF
jgi:hypothetical protein